MILKEKLLSLGVFKDNEYLDFYCSLIENNKNKKKEKFKTQCHHIIPRKYFEINGSPVDNSKSNIVNLLFKDHILAHYYLYLCSFDGRLIESNRSCIVLMCGKIDVNEIEDLDLNILQTIYEEYKKKDSERMIGNTINVGRAHTEEERKRLSEIGKHKNWENPMKNPKAVEKMRNSLLDGYRSGRIKPSRKGSKHSEESKKKMSEHCCMKKQKYRDNLSNKLKGRIPWNKGRVGVQKSKIKNKKAIHKGNINKYVSPDEIEKYLLDGWLLGGKPIKNKS